MIFNSLKRGGLKMIKRRGSQGLSLNMVVVGAIALVVLVVIVLIFNSSTTRIEDRYDKQTGSLATVSDCRELVTKLNKYDGKSESFESSEEASGSYDYIKQKLEQAISEGKDCSVYSDILNFDGIEYEFKYKSEGAYHTMAIKVSPDFELIHVDDEGKEYMVGTTG